MILLWCLYCKLCKESRDIQLVSGKQSKKIYILGVDESVMTGKLSNIEINVVKVTSECLVFETWWSDLEEGNFSTKYYK